jgi:predicted DCC family thiol-disulfide oxidoreductase YuxK
MLVYDGQCRFCERCIGIVRRWDGAGRVHTVRLQDAEEWRDVPGLSRAALEGAMHLVSPAGRVYAGAEAAAPLLGLLPGGRMLAAPLALPGAGRVAAAAYRWVARHRHALGCASPVCRRGV